MAWMALRLRSCLILVPATALLAGCLLTSPSSPTAGHETMLSSPSPVTPHGLPTVSNPDCCWFITSPAPIGESVPLAGTLSVGVIGVIRPATDIVLAASPANPTPPQGSEYLLANVSLECIAPEENPCDVSLGVQFHVTDAAGAIYEEVPDLLGIPNQFRVSQQSGGSIAQGTVAFIVPVSDNGLVLEFIWPNMTGVYLGLK